MVLTEWMPIYNVLYDVHPTHGTSADARHESTRPFSVVAERMAGIRKSRLYNAKKLAGSLQLLVGSPERGVRFDAMAREEVRAFLHQGLVEGKDLDFLAFVDGE